MNFPWLEPELRTSSRGACDRRRLLQLRFHSPREAIQEKQVPCDKMWDLIEFTKMELI